MSIFKEIYKDPELYLKRHPDLQVPHRLIVDLIILLKKTSSIKEEDINELY